MCDYRKECNFCCYYVSMLTIFYSNIFKKNGMIKECELITTHKLSEQLQNKINMYTK